MWNRQDKCLILSLNLLVFKIVRWFPRILQKQPMRVFLSIFFFIHELLDLKHIWCTLIHDWYYLYDVQIVLPMVSGKSSGLASPILSCCCCYTVIYLFIKVIKLSPPHVNVLFYIYCWHSTVRWSFPFSTFAYYLFHYASVKWYFRELCYYHCLCWWSIVLDLASVSSFKLTSDISPSFFECF